MVDIPSDALVIAAGGRFRRQDGGELLKGSKMANDSGNAVFEKMFEQLPAYQRPIAVVFTGGSCNNKARQEHFDEYLKKAQAAMDKKGDGGKVGWKYLRTDDGSSGTMVALGAALAGAFPLAPPADVLSNAAIGIHRCTTQKRGMELEPKPLWDPYAFPLAYQGVTRPKCYEFDNSGKRVQSFKLVIEPQYILRQASYGFTDDERTHIKTWRKRQIKIPLAGRPISLDDNKDIHPASLADDEDDRPVICFDKQVNDLGTYDVSHNSEIDPATLPPGIVQFSVYGQAIDLVEGRTSDGKDSDEIEFWLSCDKKANGKPVYHEKNRLWRIPLKTDPATKSAVADEVEEFPAWCDRCKQKFALGAEECHDCMDLGA